MHRGILKVTRGFWGEDQVKAFLPPEHRVVAVKLGDGHCDDEYLLEGPMLPDIDEQETPPRVVIHITWRLSPYGYVEGGTCEWQHLKGQTWRMVWPTP